MASYEVKIKTSTDASKLDELVEKLKDTVELEKETGKIIIKPDADTGEIEALVNEIVEVQEVASKPVEMQIETGSLTQGIASFGTQANGVFDSIGSKCESIGGKFESLSSSMGSLIAGIGLAEMATNAWEGATEKQNNQILLARKYGESTANTISAGINDVVKSTPGDDEFLTAMLSNASLQAKMTTTDLQNMASAIADYNIMSKASGSSSFEAEGEIRNFIMTGETGRMRDTPLAPYLDELESADTITERVDVLNKAMKELGYNGASGMQSASNSMETFKGTIQNALASVGQMFLPIIKTLLDTFLQLDDALGGNLAKALVIVGGGFAGIVAVAGALGAVLPAIGNGIKAIGTGIDILTKGPQIIKGIVSGFQSFKEIITIVREAETLSAGVNAAYSASLEAEAVASSTAGGATGFLASMEWAVLIPILLVIAAIVALVAILWYLYNNNQQVKQAIDALIETFKQLINQILTAIQPIIQFVQEGISWFMSLLPGITMALQPVFNFIMGILAQLVILGVNRIRTFILGAINFFNIMGIRINQVMSTVRGIIFAGVNAWNIMRTKATEIVNAVGNTFRGVVGKINSAFSGVKNAITAPFQQAYNILKPILDKIKAGINLLNQVPGFSGFAGFSGWSEDTSTSIGYAGFETSNLNNFSNEELLSLAGNTNNKTINQTNNFNGVFAEDGKSWVLDTVNEELERNKLIRGL